MVNGREFGGSTRKPATPVHDHTSKRPRAQPAAGAECEAVARRIGFLARDLNPDSAALASFRIFPIGPTTPRPACVRATAPPPDHRRRPHALARDEASGIPAPGSEAQRRRGGGSERTIPRTPAFLAIRKTHPAYQWLCFVVFHEAAAPLPGHRTIGKFYPEPHWLRFVVSRERLTVGHDDRTIGKLYPESHWLRFVVSHEGTDEKGEDRTIGIFFPESHWLRFVVFVEPACRRRFDSEIPSMTAGLNETRIGGDD